MENSLNVLRKVYSAILAGRIVQDERGTVYEQCFGQAFVDELKLAIDGGPLYDIIDYYRDGGTKKILYRRKIYFIDYRIGSGTPGAIYKGYPGDEDSKMIYNSIQDLIENGP